MSTVLNTGASVREPFMLIDLETGESKLVPAGPITVDITYEWFVDKYGRFHEGRPPQPGTPAWNDLFKV